MLSQLMEGEEAGFNFHALSTSIYMIVKVSKLTQVSK